MRALAAALLALAALAAPAQADSIFVSAGTSSFSPSNLDVLVGDTVIWRNNSLKTHNVQAETAGFDSGRFGPRTAVNHVFPATGVFPYVCTIHDGMTGQIGVYPLLLGGPGRPVQPGASVALHVRAPEGAGEVTIEADTGRGLPAGRGGRTSGGRRPRRPCRARHAPRQRRGDPDHELPRGLGRGLEPRAARRGERRARAGAGGEVERAARRLIDVRARPASPGTRVVLELKLRERFGWWPAARARLDRRSRARFTLRGHAGVPVRVVTVGPDWATVLSASRVLRLRR